MTLQSVNRWVLGIGFVLCVMPVASAQLPENDLVGLPESSQLGFSVIPPEIELRRGVLAIEGTINSDYIEIAPSVAARARSEVIVVRAFSSVTQDTVIDSRAFPKSEIERIEFNGKRGNDFLWVAGIDIPVTAKGGDGNDHLEGGRLGDRLIGGSGDDVLIGNAGNDELFGCEDNDTLYGRCGNDDLFGGKGNDGLFGGNGDDELTGGPGADRLLHQSGDTVNKDRFDVKIQFKDCSKVKDSSGTWWSAGAWSQMEIESVDKALHVLHEYTGNVSLLENFELIRVGSPSSATDRAGWNRHVALGPNRIYLSDWVFEWVHKHDSRPWWMVLHEIGHNWDTEHGSKGVWKGISGWTKRHKKDTKFRTSGDGNWRYRKGSAFVSNYSRNTPWDDFAETFAAYFTDFAGAVEFDFTDETPIRSAAMKSKRLYFKNWLHSLVE